jgi:hypothetical protein
MKHARSDYDSIQDNSAAIALAELVLSMDMVTSRGKAARQLAREVLGIEEPNSGGPIRPITTNGTTRLIPIDEPVFLIRGQDAVSGDAVRAWADLAEKAGASTDILAISRLHAKKMDSWPKKKVPDVPKHG